MSNNNTVEILNVEEVFKSEYVIPLYQRNFAWGEEQICQLLQDIRESINEQHYYIGSLVVIYRQNGTYEVIDGQQRLTTLALLSYVLQFKIKTKIHYDSRPEVVQFLESLAQGAIETNNDSSVSHFIAAIETMRVEVEKMQKEAGIDFKERFAYFVLNNVCLVREIMPQDTDVAAYFEIMNNRGKQLQEQDIVKGLLLGRLIDNPRLSQVCSVIWDACSQMDERVQKSFDKKLRSALFGDNYEDFRLNDNNFKEILEGIDSGEMVSKEKDLDMILKETTSGSATAYTPDEEEIPEADKEESIIDFPNFLMHVMQLYYGEDIKHTKEINGIRLHDKYLLKTFRLIEDNINVSEFIYRVLRCRVIFDRYIVKANFTYENNEEGREWSLLRPYKYQNGSKTQLRFKNTFENHQDMIIKAVSCIQVCHPSRSYKNYLQTIMSWFKDMGTIEISENEYMVKLNEFIYNDLMKESKYFGLTEYTPDLQGTAISRSVLDYIDYLIWNLKVTPTLPDPKEEKEWSMISDLQDFQFQYWNSIEHHYPQRRKADLPQEEVNDFYLNCLGNIFLIGKSTNSRLSDKNPADKAALYNDKANLAPNRQLVYRITRSSGWGRPQIESHLRFIEGLFKNAHRVLRIKPKTQCLE